MSIIQLPVTTLKSALLCVAGKRDKRKFLQGVLVDGTNIVATNSHIAFVYKYNPDGDRNNFKYVLDSVKLTEFFKRVDKQCKFVDIFKYDNDKRISITAYDRNGNKITDDIEIDTYYVDYTIPFNTNRPIETFETREIKFNLDYLGVLSKINKLITSELVFDMPKLSLMGSDCATIASWEHDTHARFYLMPMRIGK